MRVQKATKKIYTNYYNDYTHKDYTVQKNNYNINNITNNLVIDIYTLCWNEEQIIPYVIEYWKYINPRNVFVFDNNSTDNSVNLLLKYDKVKIINYESDNVFHDGYHIDIKNSCWKKSDADFVIVCDMDECVYSDHLHEILQYMKDNNQTLSNTTFISTISKVIQDPIPGQLYHTYPLTYCFIPKSFNYKVLIFNPQKIQEIKYSPGAHTCNPLGTINWYDKQYTDPIQTIHIKNLSLEYKLNRNYQYNKRLSDYNKKYMFGAQYLVLNKIAIDEFESELSTAKKYKNLLNDIL